MPKSKNGSKKFRHLSKSRLLTESWASSLEAEAINVFESLEKLSETERNELKDRLRKYLDGPLPRSKKLVVQFVVSSRPQLRISQYGSKKFYTIDILKSLEYDPINIVHPLIVNALEILAMSFLYYPRGSSPNLGVQTVKKYLRQIYQTLIDALEHHARAWRKKVIADRRLDDMEYFRFLYRLIRNPELFQVANGAKRIRLIKESLEEYSKQNIPPEWVKGSSPTLDFLITLDPKKLPKDWRALHTSFLEWEFSLTDRNPLSKKTIRQYIWEGRLKYPNEYTEYYELLFARTSLAMKAHGLGRPFILTSSQITGSNLVWEEGAHKNSYVFEGSRIISGD